MLEVYAEYSEIRAKWEVASRKYAAVRDMVRSYIGKDPYRVPLESFLVVGNDPSEYQSFPSKGRFRFLYMPVGDAAYVALQEAETPQSLEDLVKTLRAGGIGNVPEILTRALNAALMRKSGIEKTEDGKYLIPRSDIEPDGIPS